MRPAITVRGISFFLNWFYTRTCGAWRPHVWLCHALLVFSLHYVGPYGRMAHIDNNSRAITDVIWNVERNFIDEIACFIAQSCPFHANLWQYVLPIIVLCDTSAEISTCSLFLSLLFSLQWYNLLLRYSVGWYYDDRSFSLLGRALLPIDYVACCIPVLVGRVIGIVHVHAEVSMKFWSTFFALSSLQHIAVRKSQRLSDDVT